MKTFFENILNTCYPLSFLELLAGLLLILVLAISILLFIPKIHSKLLTIISILLMVSLTLFANNFWIYFLCMLVIATSITNVEFLENIAAIIRNSDSYFKYKSSQATKKQVENKIEDEILTETESSESELINNTTMNPIHNSAPDNNKINDFVKLEELALSEEEKYFKSKIERNIIFRNKSQNLCVDGIIDSAVDDMISVKLFEVKILRNLDLLLNNVEMIKRIESVYGKYISITHKIAKLNLTIVVRDESSIKQEQINKLKELIDKSEYISSYSLYTEKFLIQKD